MCVDAHEVDTCRSRASLPMRPIIAKLEDRAKRACRSRLCAGTVAPLDRGGPRVPHASLHARMPCSRRSQHHQAPSIHEHIRPTRTAAEAAPEGWLPATRSSRLGIGAAPTAGKAPAPPPLAPAAAAGDRLMSRGRCSGPGTAQRDAPPSAQHAPTC
jgi:hypothetical protein